MLHVTPNCRIPSVEDSSSEFNRFRAGSYDNVFIRAAVPLFPSPVSFA